MSFIEDYLKDYCTFHISAYVFYTFPSLNDRRDNGVKWLSTFSLENRERLVQVHVPLQGVHQWTLSVLSRVRNFFRLSELFHVWHCVSFWNICSCFVNNYTYQFYCYSPKFHDASVNSFVVGAFILSWLIQWSIDYDCGLWLEHRKYSCCRTLGQWRPVLLISPCGRRSEPLQVLQNPAKLLRGLSVVLLHADKRSIWSDFHQLYPRVAVLQV